MPSQDVIPHHPCSGSTNEPFLKYLDSPENFRDLSILADCDTDKSIVQNMTIYGKVKRHLFKNVRSMDTIMRLDDVWLQTTLNTPNISGVWQIKKWSHLNFGTFYEV
jgi:hypothetical protein